MKITCELNDYGDRANAYENPKLIVQNNLVAHDDIFMKMVEVK